MRMRAFTKCLIVQEQCIQLRACILEQAYVLREKGGHLLLMSALRTSPSACTGTASIHAAAEVEVVLLTIDVQHGNDQNMHAPTGLHDAPSPL